ncbi:MAG: hypothetical protein RR731_02575 [Oscillospiraceae bacterium]
MKKTLLILLTALMLLSLVGCGGKPTDEKIKAALEEGKITMEDAKDKGWIDDAWIEANIEIFEGATKIFAFDEFNTSYLDGTPVSSKIISGTMCLVFFDSTSENALEKLEVFKENAAELEKIGTPILGVITDDDVAAAKEKLGDLPFPVIVFNEEMQTSLERFKDIVSDGVVSVFTKDGGFYSAWISKTDSGELLRLANDFGNEK